MKNYNKILEAVNRGI